MVIVRALSQVKGACSLGREYDLKALCQKTATLVSREISWMQLKHEVEVRLGSSWGCGWAKGR